MPRIHASIWLFLGLSLWTSGSFGGVCSTNPPAAWPASDDSAWQQLPAPLGGWITDPEEGLGFWDGVGSGNDIQLAGGLWAEANGATFFRVRLAETPAKESGGGGWNSFGFHVLIEADGDTTSSWDYAVVLQGIANQVVIQQNTTKEMSDWCGDAGEVNSFCYTATHLFDMVSSTFPDHARVTPACSSLGSASICNVAMCKLDLDADDIWDGDASCTDVFLDVQVPSADLATAIGLAPEFLFTPVVLGTGSNGSALSKDILGAECASGWDGLVGQRDIDGDGVLDMDEGAFGTDPLDPDSDDDGLPDGEELLGPDLEPSTGDEPGTDAIDPDSDNDGLCDSNRQDSFYGPWYLEPRTIEGDSNGDDDDLDPSDSCTLGELAPFGSDPGLVIGTDPGDADTDDGGIDDGTEVLVDATEPVSTPQDDQLDSDTDGVTDWNETHVLGTDPMDDDTDDDGLLDGTEDVNRNGSLDSGESDPLAFDTDMDLLSDGLESGRSTAEGNDTDLATFVADVDTSTTTDKRDRDSDDDGLEDGVEDFNGNGRVDSTETDPNLFDTDEDGYGDGLEIETGSDPLDEFSIPPDPIFFDGFELMP